MRAGGRPYYAEILRWTETRSPVTNASVKTWNVIGKAWVSFVATRGSELYLNDAETAQRVVRVTGDSMELADVNPKDRIRLENGTLIDVVAVLVGSSTRADTVVEGVTGDGVRP